MRSVVGVLLVAIIPLAAAQELSPKVQGLAIYAPKPDYSLEARSHWKEGRGIFVINVRPDGAVESVEVAKSTGHTELDKSAVAAFEKWRFRPGVVAPKLKIPLEFTLAGLKPAGIDAALRAEREGKQPVGDSSWPDYWKKCIAAWKAYHRPQYGDYFRKRREVVGLQAINAQ